MLLRNVDSLKNGRQKQDLPRGEDLVEKQKNNADGDWDRIAC